MPEIDQYLEEHRDRFESELCDFLRIPSVSTDPAYRSDVIRAAEWLAQHLADLDLEVELIRGESGPPLVFATTAPVPGKPVALVYGHYDVQPPDPLNEWITPPFEPTEREGNLYARGATDDKGQMLTHVKSVEAWLKAAGELPLQVKFLIEGEEEVGSEHLHEFLQSSAAQEKLACDVVVISDTSQFAPGQPAITYGLRGIAYYELRLTGPKQDLHSGTFGGGVTNPARALVGLLASLVDEKGRVQIPGFYDDVQPLSDNERNQFDLLPFDEQRYFNQLGVTGTSGETGYSILERRWARPSYDINGLWSGYQGQGAKTVLPARAGAKFSFRLVPDQDPEKITAALKLYFESQLPPGIEMDLREFHGSPGVVVPLDSPYMTAAAHAIEKGFDRPPVFIREGGSIPIVTEFTEQLGAPVLLLGWGRDDDNTHSPNEKFSLADFHYGTLSSAHLWAELAKVSPEEK